MVVLEGSCRKDLNLSTHCRGWDFGLLQNAATELRLLVERGRTGLAFERWRHRSSRIRGAEAHRILDKTFPEVERAEIRRVILAWRGRSQSKDFSLPARSGVEQLRLVKEIVEGGDRITDEISFLRRAVLWRCFDHDDVCSIELNGSIYRAVMYESTVDERYVVNRDLVRESLE